MNIKVVLFILIFFWLTPCFLNEKQGVAANTESTANRVNKLTTEIKQDSLENCVYDLIFNLPEMKSYFQKVDSIFHGEIHPTLIIVSKPTKEEPYYWVQAGINDTTRMIPEYNFYVYPKQKLEVKFYDTMNDEIISLAEWRAKEKK